MTSKAVDVTTPWWFAGEGVLASTATMLTAPLYVAVIWLARRTGFGARLALPVAGVADTVFATKLFGAARNSTCYPAP